jgi:hypothetical protein
VTAAGRTPSNSKASSIHFGRKCSGGADPHRFRSKIGNAALVDSGMDNACAMAEAQPGHHHRALDQEQRVP